MKGFKTRLAALLVALCLLPTLLGAGLSGGQPARGEQPAPESAAGDVYEAADAGSTLVDALSDAELEEAIALGYLPGKVLLTFSGAVAGDDAAAVVSAAGDAVAAVENAAADGLAVVADIAEGQSVAEAIAGYEAEPQVLAAQPVYLYMADEVAVEAAADVNDMREEPLHHLNSVRAYDAWDTLAWAKDTDTAYSKQYYPNGYDKVQVAVLDNMPHLTHPDLQKNVRDDLFRDFEEYTYEGDKDKNGNWYVPKPADGHGTHILGVISATANNGIGVAGTGSGFANEVLETVPLNIHNTKIPDHYSVVWGDSLSLSMSLRYAARQGYKVINVGVYRVKGYIDSIDAWSSGTDEAVINSAKFAYDNDCVIIAPAGNQGTNDAVVYPAGLPYVMGVINLLAEGDGPAETHASYAVDATRSPRNPRSSYATLTDITASPTNVLPSAQVNYISAPGTQVMSTFGAKGYATLTGTSVSSAVVAGVAAMVRYANPDLTAAQVYDTLRRSARDVYTSGFDAETGHGCVDAEAAVRLALAIQSSTPEHPYTIMRSSTSDTSVAMAKGDTLQLDCELFPRGKEGTIHFDSNAPGVVAVDPATGLMEAKAVGVASVIAQTSAYGFSQPAYNVTVYDPALPFSLEQPVYTIQAGERLWVGTQPGDVPNVSWETSDGTVLKLGTISNPGGAYFTGMKAGTATVTATTPDGRQASARVTVKAAGSTAPAASITLNKTSVVAPIGAATSVTATITGYGANAYDPANIGASLVNLGTGLAVDVDDVFDNVVAGLPPGTPAGGNDYTIQLTPKAGTAGSYLLTFNSVNGVAAASLRVTVTESAAPPATDADFAPLHLDPATVTLWTRSSLGAQVTLRQNAGEGALADLSDTANVTLQFADADLRNLFTFTGTGLNTAAVKATANLPAKPRSSYTGALQVKVTNTNGTFTLPVAESLVIKLKTGNPSLKTTAISINTFYDAPADLTAAITVSGEVDAVRLRAGKTAPDWLADVSGNLQKTQVVASPADQKTRSATLALEALPKGFDTGNASHWVAVGQKVTIKYQKPGVKLASATAPMYAGASFTGAPMTLKATISKNTLASLGVWDLNVADANSAQLSVEGFDRKTGAFTLVPLVSVDSLPAKAVLNVRFTGTGQVVPLNVTLKKVAANTTVRLTASPKTVTLNPNLRGGESYDLAIGTNVAGYVIDFDKMNISVNGKPSGVDLTAPTANIVDGKLRLAVGENVAGGSSWKVNLELVGAYANSKGLQTATLALTVKTCKKTTERADYGATVKLSKTGSVDLTTGAGATLKAKFTRYNGEFAKGAPTFTVRDKQGVVLPARLFNYERIAANQWRVTPNYNAGAQGYGVLVPSTYTIGIDTYNSPIGNESRVVKANEVKLTVKATAPKVTLGTKTVTLYRKDAGSTALLDLGIAANGLDVTGIRVKSVGASASPFGAYIIRGGTQRQNQYALGFNNTDPTTADVLRAAAQSGTVTLEIFLEGNAAPAATVKVKVVVKDW